MRVAVVGSRDYYDLSLVRRYVEGLPAGTVVVSGGARGVDQAAADAAKNRGLEVVEYRADWDLDGRAAGMLRNIRIVDDCDRVVAFWDGRSRGTFDTITKAFRAGKHVEVNP